MMRRVVPLMVLFAACGGVPASAPFSGSPLQTLTSDSGALHVAVWSNPQPPPASNDEFRLTITDANGKPVDGLQLSMKPWMPLMHHGTSVVPTVTPLGAGKYDVANVDLFMSGLWQLQTTITGQVTDSVNPEFQVN